MIINRPSEGVSETEERPSFKEEPFLLIAGGRARAGPAKTLSLSLLCLSIDVKEMTDDRTAPNK